MAYAESPGTSNYYKRSTSTNGEGHFQNFGEEGDLPDYPGSTELSAESVIAMAQSVGVSISEDIAGALGELTIRKLRYATLLAMQFSDHENTSGLRVSDFSKAEDLLNSPSYGHKSSLPPSVLKPIGLARVSVFDEGPEIDLLTSVSSSKVSEVVVEDSDPTFYVCRPNVTDRDSFTELEECAEECEVESLETETSFDLSEIPLLDIKKESASENETEDMLNEDKTEDNMLGENEESIPTDENALVLFNQNHVDGSNEADVEEIDESNYEILISSNCLEHAVENHVDEIEENDPDEADDLEDDDHELELEEIVEDLQSEEGIDFINDNMWEVNERLFTLDPEWINYIKVFVACFLNDSPNQRDPCELDDEEDNDEEDEDFESDSFRRILIDLQKHGAYPVLDVICDLFRDYIRGLIIPVSVIGLNRMFSVINAFLMCPSTPSLSQMRMLSSVLIEVFILPPPCEVQQRLTQVFMQILRRYDELLTWTCTYITEVLKKTIEMPSNDSSEAYKSVIHGALCLTNGLETLKIQVAQEFGWHSSIVNLSKRQTQEFDGCSHSAADGYIEEQILIFCRNFLLNYKRLVTSIEMQRIHNSMKDVFGEKLIPYLCRKENFTSRKFRTRMQIKPNAGSLAQKVKHSKNTCYIFRRGYYKNRKVTIPYKSLVSSGL